MIIWIFFFGLLVSSSGSGSSQRREPTETAAMATSDDNQTASEDDLELNDLLVLANISATTPFPLDYVTKLDLPNCGISSLPIGLPEALPNLSILFLSKNEFSEVPALLGRCKNLQMMAFRDNQLESIHPDALQPHTRWLILTNNKLQGLPDEIGNCRDLQKLMLSGNQITCLPNSISQCQKLELVRLASNKLSAPPMDLLKIPSLRWAGLSDNPFLDDVVVDVPSLKVLDVVEDDGEVLGRGAGGVTRKVTFQGESVAVKQYQGQMTSDGTPEHERKISCATSSLSSKCLIKVLGETPSGSLVMEYLHNYDALAGPPSMKSCSRDVYEDPSPIVHGEQAERLISALLDGLAELHGLGLVHADFYGHNILYNAETNDVRLSDFGAAYFYDKKAPYGKLLQQTEMRAFGVLVAEVAALIKAESERSNLQELVDEIGNRETMEDLRIWWKQQQLKNMAAEFDPDS